MCIWLGERRGVDRDMETINIKCGVCENQCELEVQAEDGEVLDVMGNRCLKGFSYAQRAVYEQTEEKL